MSKSLKIILISAGLLIAAVIVLNLLGRSLVTEITQEVKIEEALPAPEVKTGTGEKAPYFELPNVNGQTVKLTDFSGKTLALIFWTTWNQQSADQLKIANDVWQKNPNFGLAAVNSQEDKIKVVNFLNRGGYNLPALLDEKGVVTDQYRARNLPATYFIDKKGLIRETKVGLLSEQEVFDILIKYQ